MYAHLKSISRFGVTRIPMYHEGQSLELNLELLETGPQQLEHSSTTVVALQSREDIIINIHGSSSRSSSRATAPVLVG
jgi:hypothetical protein